MKINALATLLLFLTIACPVLGDHHDHGHGHGDGHGKEEASKKLSNDNQYLSNINLIKGHLWVGIELYKNAQIENAKKHMKHPKAELYAAMIPTFKAKGAAGFASQLERLALSVENEESYLAVINNYQNLLKAINVNEQFVAKASTSVDQKILLVISLLEIAAEEYAMGIVNGSVENKFEYQDALGFTTMAKNILEDAATEDKSQKQRLSNIASIVNKLSFLWPELAPNSNVNGDAKTILNAIAEIKDI